MSLGKALTQDQIKKILSDDDLKRAQNPHERVTWPSMEDKARLLKAIKSNAPIVQMADQRKFKIRYVKDEHVYVSPFRQDDMVPCGWFTIDKLERELSEAEVL